MSGSQHPATRRAIQVSIAAVALAAALIISVSASYGWLHFQWGAAKLLAKPEVDRGHYDLSNILVLNRVVLHLQENYVDPKRIDPRLMLATGLNEVQKNVAEIVVTFDRPPSKSPTEVAVHVGEHRKDFRLDDVDNLWEMSLKFQDIFRFIKTNLSAETDQRAVEYRAVNGMLDTLDPHSVLMSAEYYKSMQEGNRGNFGGLGIVIRMVDGYLTVINPMKNTPASRAGIIKGDRVVKIDTVATLNMELSDAVTLLRGEPGTKVTLTIERDESEWETPKPFTLTRDMIKIPSVEHANLGDNIAYIRLKGFQDNTYKDMVSSLQTLKGEMNSEIKGLVLDMRGNPGGLLNRAIEISDEFVKSGTLVTTVGKGNSLNRSYPAHESDTEPEYPIVVLVDPGSASASEIVAGALKNHNRALIVGDRSFGKGSVQVLYELDDGSALKLTIAQYLTPGEVSIQGVGIVPDVKLRAMKAEALDDVDMFPERWIRREASLKSHLSNQKTVAGEKPSVILKYLDDTPEVSEDSDEEAKPDSDHQVRISKDLLLSAGETWEREALLKKLEKDLARLEAEEDRKLTDHLASFDIDWSPGPLPSASEVKVELTSDPDPMTLAPGSTVTVTATLTNEGDESIPRVFGLTDSTNGDFAHVELIFGRLDPGASLSRSFKVKIDGDERTRYDRIDLALYAGSEPRDDDSGVVARSFLDIQTIGEPLPHFALNYVIRDDIAGNGDGRVNPGETVHVRVFMENRGDGASTQPISFLRSQNGARAELRDARHIADAALAANERRVVDFTFEAAADLDEEGGDLMFEAHLYDKVVGRAVMEKIALPVAQSPTPAEQLENMTARVIGGATELLSVPRSKSHVVMHAKDGDTLKVLASRDDAFLVAAGDLSGWVLGDRLSAPESGTADAVVATPALAHTGSPPTARLAAATPVTEASSVDISGVVEDDGEVRDYYVFVYSETDHQFESRKVTYRRLDAKKTDINFPVALRQGLNRIKVVIRDNDEMETVESIYVYRR